MSKINKFRKPTVAILTALLIISIAMPLLSLTTAATNSFSLLTTSGPNGTAVKVSGVGFTPSQAEHSGATPPITVLIDGSDAHAYVRDSAGKVDFSDANELQTDVNGVLSGYFVIYGLSVGTHTVQISDAGHSPAGVIFTVTRPTITLSAPSGAVGTSELITGSGFPLTPEAAGGPVVTNYVATAAFPTGTPITVPVAGTTSTATATELSSSVIDMTTGTYSATVTIRGAVSSTSDNTFSMVDAFGNTAMAAFGVTSGAASLSLTSGGIGTSVTATVTGFGPGATINHVYFGNGASPTDTTIAAVTGATLTVNQAGSGRVKFTVPSTGVDCLAGAKTVLITDSFGNTATATFTIRAKVSVTVGSASASSNTGMVPTGETACLWLTASGFTPYTKLTIIGSPGVPTAWTTFADADITTDQYGKISTAVKSTATAVAPAVGTLSVTVSDGTSTPAPVILTVITLPYLTITPSGPTGAGMVSIGGWSEAGTQATATTFDGSAPAGITEVTPGVWPAAATPGTFTVPAAATAGAHAVVVTLPVVGDVQLSYTVTTTGTVTAFPLSVGVGQNVQLSGSGYKASATPRLTIDGVTVSAANLQISATGSLSGYFTMPAFLAGNHTIVVTDAATSPIVTGTSSVNSTTASITVTPSSATLTTTQADGTEAPTTLAITGTGFAAGEILTVKFDGVTITAASAVGLTVVNPSGAILLDSGFRLPGAAAAGTHTISVSGAGTASAIFTFTVQPKILLAPTAVRAGQHVGISGTGFASGSALTLTLNGSLSTWYNIGTSPETAVTTSVTTATGADIGSLLSSSSFGAMIASSTAAGNVVVTVTDSAGHAATATLVILGAPAIVVSSTNLVPGAQAGTATTDSTAINGTGFTTGTGRPISVKLLSDSITQSITNPALLANTVTVSTTGAFNVASGLQVETFVVPSSVPAGTYTLQVTVGSASDLPIETATTTVTVMAAPALTVASQGAAMANITLTVTGMTSIDSVTIGGTALVTANVAQPDAVMTALTGVATNRFGPVAIPASNNTVTTWFIVPENLFAGSYTITVQDTHANVIAIAPFTVTPGIAITTTPTVKGDAGVVEGYGFAPSSRITVTLNGAALPESTSATISTDAEGKFTTTLTTEYNFIVPASAATTNTITVTDASANTASTTLVLGVPQIIVNPTSAQAGSSVQVIGTGFKAGTTLFVQVGGSVVATNPLTVTATGGSFVCYITIPTATPQGNTTISATDTANNQASAIFLVTNGGSSTGITVNTSTMSSTAQTTNGAGQATTTFTQGSTVKTSFSLASSNGASGNVVASVTFQQGAKVYNMQSGTYSISPTASTVSFSNLIPAGATGTWTATLQVYAADGTTPLAVTTLTFTVS